MTGRVLDRTEHDKLTLRLAALGVLEFLVFTLLWEAELSIEAIPDNVSLVYQELSTFLLDEH